MNTTTNYSNKKEANVQSLADRAERKANNATRNIREMAEEAGSEIRHYLHDATERADAFRHEAEDRISRHPLQAVAIAAVGGLLLGALLRK